MPGCYGSMLSAFPELIKSYEVFNMKPRIGAGYGERYNKRAVRGYWSWRKRSELGIQGDLRTENYDATFWAKDDEATGECLIRQKDYVEVKGKIFIVMDDQNFSHEGAFARCLMRRLAGPTDQQVANTSVDEVVVNDY